MTQELHAQLRVALEEIERFCPCGARPESPHTHPHGIGCPVATALDLARKVAAASPSGGWQPDPRIAEIRARLEKATPGPYQVVGPTGYIYTVGDPYGHGPMHVAQVRGWGHLTGHGACNLTENEAVAIQDANAALLAEAWADLRYLLDRLPDPPGRLDGPQGATE